MIKLGEIKRGKYSAFGGRIPKSKFKAHKGSTINKMSLVAHMKGKKVGYK